MLSFNHGLFLQSAASVSFLIKFHSCWGLNTVHCIPGEEGLDWLLHRRHKDQRWEWQCSGFWLSVSKNVENYSGKEELEILWGDWAIQQVHAWSRNLLLIFAQELYRQIGIVL